RYDVSAAGLRLRRRNLAAGKGVLAGTQVDPGTPLQPDDGRSGNGCPRQGLTGGEQGDDIHSGQRTAGGIGSVEVAGSLNARIGADGSGDELDRHTLACGCLDGGTRVRVR